MNGTEDQPVVLKPSGTADEDGWPGILVLGDGAVSRLAWVQIENTTGFRLGGWAMTGGMIGIGFYLLQQLSGQLAGILDAAQPQRQ